MSYRLFVRNITGSTLTDQGFWVSEPGGWPLTWVSVPTLGTGFNPGSPVISSLGQGMVLNDRLVFAGWGGTVSQPNVELWASGGTAAGTRLLKDVNPGLTGSDPYSLTRVGDKVFFFARDANGTELWVTDGTEGGTRMVRDIAPGVLPGIIDPRAGMWGPVAGKVYFVADDRVSGQELWESDGSVAGTRLVQDLVPGNDIILPAVFGILPVSGVGIRLEGTPGPDRLVGTALNDTLYVGDGADLIFGGETAADVRDVIYGGNGNDTIDGGHGNDELRGDAGDDVLIGGFGADTLIGGEGNDRLDGGALGDVLFGGPGNDYFNGGFGFDRLNGGAGADTFFHLGVAGHGSDWIQDYNAAEGDVLQTGIAGATKANFQINIATTPGAGAATVAEAFVIYRPTGQILFALVDGAGQSSINMILGGQVVDLLG
ncbi:MAG: hypothetical protein ACK4KW_01615 [Gemmobacter sp.]